MTISRNNSNLLNLMNNLLMEQDCSVNIVKPSSLVAQDGTRNINQNLWSQKHNAAETALTSTRNIVLYMVKCDVGESNKIAAAEAIRHGLCVTVKAFGQMNGYTSSWGTFTNQNFHELKLNPKQQSVMFWDYMLWKR